MSNETTYTNKDRNGKVFVGLLLLAIGGVYLLRDLDILFFPYWLFRWPMILILAGLYTGAKHNFRNNAWLFLTAIGIIFLLEPFVYIPVWPMILIVAGVFVIFRRNHRTARNITWDARTDRPQADPFNPDATVDPLDAAYTKDTGTNFSNASNLGPDFVDCTSFFGSVKRIVLSKTFKGGDIVNVFGGTEIDLSQADINGRVVIDITQLFGGIKLIVPPHWVVVSEAAAIFSGVDDKRRVFGAVQQNPDKVLVLKGTSIMAGIDIRTY